MKKLLKGLLVVCAFVFVLVGVTGCGDEGLVGSWKHGSFVYTFNKDKTGNYSFGNNKMKFKYEDNGKKVKITYDGNTTGSTYEYKIDGKKLIIKDSFGKDVEYTRK